MTTKRGRERLKVGAKITPRTEKLSAVRRRTSAAASAPGYGGDTAERRTRGLSGEEQHIGGAAERRVVLRQRAARWRSRVGSFSFSFNSILS